MTGPRILIAGIGNIFLGDDGFGVEVARALAARPLPAGVRLVDFGIRGLDLAYALLDGYAAAILIDAAPRGEAPGTLYLIEQQLADDDQPAAVETHGMTPEKVLRMVKALGGWPGRMLVVGCEPTTLASEDEWLMELSAPVRAAVSEAVAMVESLVRRLLDAQKGGTLVEPGSPAR